MKKNMIRKVVSLLLVFATVFSLGVGTPALAAPAGDGGDGKDSVERYTVLVLDTSASSDFLDNGRVFYTADTAIDYVKASARKFMADIQNAGGTNYVAVVEYKGAEAEVVSTFSDNLTELSSAIDGLEASGNTRNIAAGLQQAEDLIDQIENPDAVKNVVLFTTGMTNDGEYNYEGHYNESTVGSGWRRTDTDVRLYAYANMAYEAAELLKDKALVYSIGLFQQMDNMPERGKEVVELFRLTASELATSSEYFYDVKNPEDLEFAFGEVADDITQEQLKQMYVDQHLSYYNTDFKTDIQEIGIPDEDGLVEDNTNVLLGNLVLDAATDNVSAGYELASFVADTLNMEFEGFGDGLVQNYELILADIVTSSYYRDILKEAYDVSAMDSTRMLYQSILEYGNNSLDELAAQTGVPVETIREAWDSLEQIVAQMNACTDPESFADLTTKSSDLVNTYTKGADLAKFLNGLQGQFDKSALSSVKKAVGDALLDTLSEIVIYYASYEAYCSASDTFQEVLTLIGASAAQVIQTDAEGNTVYIGGVDRTVYATALSLAARSFLDNAQEEATGAQAVAQRFIESGFENLGEESFKTMAEEMLNSVPVIKEVNDIREKIGLTAEGTMLLVDYFTEIDDRAYSASMLYQLYYLAEYAREASDYCGQLMVNGPDQETTFDWAYRFDESVRIWRCCTMMMCDLGMEFETYCLQDVQESLLSWTVWSAEDASWRSTAISMAAVEKSRISDIHCHSVNLSYDPSEDRVEWDGDTQVILIACPVSVMVTNENNEQIALLEDQKQTVAEGYESYFHVFETGNETGDYMKICYVPDTWNISFTGTGDGMMQVLKSHVKDGEILRTTYSSGVPVSDGLQGHLTDEADPVVIDSDGVYTITFDPNGGTLNEADSTRFTDVQGKLVSMPEDPVREDGAAFHGWFTAQEGGDAVETGDTFTGDAIVYARWADDSKKENPAGDNAAESQDPAGDVNGSSGNDGSPADGSENAAGDSSTDSGSQEKSGSFLSDVLGKPETGDESGAGKYIAVMLAAGAGLATVVIVGRRRSRKNRNGMQK